MIYRRIAANNYKNVAYFVVHSEFRSYLGLL